MGKCGEHSLPFNISFGKIRQAPKNAPRWLWRCDCGCNAVHGPFKTLKEAERDAEQACVSVAEKIFDAQDEQRTATIQ